MQEACRDEDGFCVELPPNLCHTWGGIHGGVIPEGRSGGVSVKDRQLIWKESWESFGQWPSDVAGKRVELPDYPQFLPFMVHGFISEFRKRLPFRRDVLSSALKVFDTIKSDNGCDSNCTMVSVHLRLGDYTAIMHAKHEPAIVTETDYLKNAFAHVIQNYQNTVFYILGEFRSETSDVVSGLQRDFPAAAIVLTGDKRQGVDKTLHVGVDMALLAMGDVTIITYGSFGDFGALLYHDKKEVLFPKDHPAHDETGVNKPGISRFHSISWKATAKAAAP